MQVWLTFAGSSQAYTCTHCVPIFLKLVVSVRCKISQASPARAR